ncbi:MAG: hypothetical protein ACFFB0_01560 [Promethearchaeota archaeon]
MSYSQIHEYSKQIPIEKTLFSNPLSSWNLDGNIICDSDNIQENQQICRDGFGGAIIVWQDFRNGSQYDIYAQHINAEGNIEWLPNGIPVCTNEYSQIKPQICNDGTGGAIIVWEDKRGQSGTNSNIYAQRINSTGGVEWIANGTPISTTINNDKYNPQICANESGGAIMTWESTINNEIYAQAIDLDGNVQWATNGELIATFDYRGEPKICSDGAGGAIIIWEEGFLSDLNIYAQRINSTGEIEWTPTGEPICTKAENQEHPQICSDGAGGALIAWEDNRDIDFFGRDIWAQRIDANGNKLWGSNDVGACREDYNQYEPFICNDGSGGAYIVWRDARTTGSDIYAQRIAPNGERQWRVDGLAICDMVAHQGSAKICSDGSGGAIIAYRGYDHSYGYDDIFIQKIDSNGDHQWSHYIDDIGWNTDEIPVCKASGDQFSPQICSDDDGGAVVVWKDYRSGSGGDIYAQHIRSAPPTSERINLIETHSDDTYNLYYVLYDDHGGGKYRILVEDPNETQYLYINWATWNSEVNLDIPINRTIQGDFIYTIEYYDDHEQFGYPDSFTVRITPPYSDDDGNGGDDGGDDGDSNGDGDGNGNGGGIIPGYNILFLIGAICISSLFFTKKRRKQ